MLYPSRHSPFVFGSSTEFGRQLASCSLSEKDIPGLIDLSGEIAASPEFRREFSFETLMCVSDFRRPCSWIDSQHRERFGRRHALWLEPVGRPIYRAAVEGYLVPFRAGVVARLFEVSLQYFSGSLFQFSVDESARAEAIGWTTALAAIWGK